MKTRTNKFKWMALHTLLWIGFFILIFPLNAQIKKMHQTNDIQQTQICNNLSPVPGVVNSEAEEKLLDEENRIETPVKRAKNIMSEDSKTILKFFLILLGIIVCCLMGIAIGRAIEEQLYSIMSRE